MIADSFEELVSRCVLSGFPHRLLFVFVRAAFMEDDAADGETGEVVRIVFDRHRPAKAGLTFAEVRVEADAENPDWNLVVLGIAKNSDASLPGDEQAAAFLADMREKIRVGDIGAFSLLDRQGQALDVETNVVDDPSGAPSIH